VTKSDCLQKSITAEQGIKLFLFNRGSSEIDLEQEEEQTSGDTVLKLEKEYKKWIKPLLVSFEQLKK
jgi:hypothetical protein